MFQGRAAALLLLLAGFGVYAASDAPHLSVSAGTQNSSSAAAISVEASDAEGLASLAIVCKAADAGYQLNLAGPAPNRRFQRTFTLAEVAPGLEKTSGAVQLDVTVRSTRGMSAHKSVILRLHSEEKK